MSTHWDVKCCWTPADVHMGFLIGAWPLLDSRWASVQGNFLTNPQWLRKEQKVTSLAHSFLCIRKVFLVPAKEEVSAGSLEVQKLKDSLGRSSGCYLVERRTWVIRDKIYDVEMHGAQRTACLWRLTLVSLGLEQKARWGLMFQDFASKSCMGSSSQSVFIPVSAVLENCLCLGFKRCCVIAHQVMEMLLSGEDSPVCSTASKREILVCKELSSPSLLFEEGKYWNRNRRCFLLLVTCPLLIMGIQGDASLCPRTQRVVGFD